MSDPSTTKSLWTTYTAVRFATGKKSQHRAARLAGNLFLLWVLAPITLFRQLRRVRVMTAEQHQASLPIMERDIPRTHSGLPRRQTDMESLLDEMMKED